MGYTPREPAHPSGKIPGSAPPSRPIRSAGQRAEPAFNTSPGASTNKTAVGKERQAFKTRGGPGNAA
jgi:hypothetical protein